MFIVSLLSWWYGAGWRQRLAMIKGRLAMAIDYFSIGLLIKTLFAPYRQISAGSVNGPIGVRWQAFVDRLISRFIGAFVRLVVMIVGMFAIMGLGLISTVLLIGWGLVPVLPLIGLIVSLIGWVPTWM